MDGSHENEAQDEANFRFQGQEFGIQDFINVSSAAFRIDRAPSRDDDSA
jgi:hypothetical protein